MNQPRDTRIILKTHLIILPISDKPMLSINQHPAEFVRGWGGWGGAEDGSGCWGAGEPVFLWLYISFTLDFVIVVFFMRTVFSDGKNEVEV